MYEYLINTLRKTSCFDCDPCDHRNTCEAEGCFIQKAADAIEELQEDNAALNGTVTNLLEQIKDLGKPRWISTEELLPKDLQNVLVLDDGRVTIGHCEHFYGDEQIYVEWHDTLYYQIDPPYWMPLPEPPKEKT